MAVHALSALLAAIVTLALGFAVVLRERRTRAQTFLAVLCFNLAAWHISSFLDHTFTHPLLQWIATLWAVAIPLSAVRFFLSFLAPKPHSAPRLPRPLWLGAAALYAVLLAMLFFHTDRFLQPLRLVVLCYVFGGFSYILLLIDRRRREATSQVERMRLLYLLVGAAVSVVLSLADLIPGLGSGGKVLSNVFVVIYLYFLTQALFRYRLLDLNEVLGRIVVLSTLVLLLGTIYGLLLVWVGSEESGVFYFNTLVASFVILVLIDPLRHTVEAAANRLLFRERWELRQRLEQLKRELASIIDIGETVRRVLRHLEETRRVSHAAIYLIDSDGSGFDVAGCVGPAPVARIDVALERPFLDRLRRDGRVSAEVLERELAPRVDALDDAEREKLQRVADTLAAMHAGVCLAMMSDEVLLGLLCLQDDRLREAYSSEELKLLRSVAAQAAITIQNSKVYERMRERERLAVIGEMAAGLAHEIRNPLGAIKGAAQLLEADPVPMTGGQGDGARTGGTQRPGAGTQRPGAGGEGDQAAGAQALHIIVEETNRLNKVVSQFLDFARPYRGDQRLLQVEDVVRRTVPLLEKEQTEGTVTVTLDLGDHLPAVRADAEQLRQVFLNLGLNALQAMGSAGGELRISTRLRTVAQRHLAPALVEVSFRDTGPGIDESELANLFIPFYTTKHKGTGLGLSICERIVEHHGGAIEVRSTRGEGTRVTVVLPVEADAVTAVRDGAGRDAAGEG